MKRHGNPWAAFARSVCRLGPQGFTVRALYAPAGHFEIAVREGAKSESR